MNHPHSSRFRTSKYVVRFGTAGLLASAGVLGSSLPASASVLPMALTSYVDTTTNVAHVFYLAEDGGVYTASAPLGQVSSSTSWSCQSALPPMSFKAGFGGAGNYSVVTGGMMPGSNLAAAYDGTNGHLFYMGNDGGIWAADGNPPNAASAHSVNKLVSAAPMPQSQATSWCLPTTCFGKVCHFGSCFQGVNNPATIAASPRPGEQNILYQGTDGVLHNLNFGWPWFSGWQMLNVGNNGVNALNGRGLASSGVFSNEAFFDNAIGGAEIWSQWGVFGQNGQPPGLTWGQDDSLNVDYQGFLGASGTYQGGNMGIAVAGPDPSTSLPALDTANNADPTNAWTVGTTNVPVVPAGPILKVGAGWEITAPNGQSSWTYFVGSDGQVYTSDGHVLSDRALVYCKGCTTPIAAQSTANTKFTPLTGFYSTVDSSTHVFYIGADNNVWEFNLPGGTLPSNTLSLSFTQINSGCPLAMY